MSDDTVTLPRAEYEALLKQNELVQSRPTNSDGKYSPWWSPASTSRSTCCMTAASVASSKASRKLARFAEPRKCPI
jgi:hypothetical protein